MGKAHDVHVVNDFKVNLDSWCCVGKGSRTCSGVKEMCTPVCCHDPMQDSAQQYRHTDRERNTHTDRERNRHTDRERNRHRHTDRERNKQTDRERNIHTDRERNRHTGRKEGATQGGDDVTSSG